MEKNEIKKVLYKEKPVAQIQDKLDDCYTYATHCSLGWITFSVPISEMGEKLFEDEISAQLLIRWLNTQ